MKALTPVTGAIAVAAAAGTVFAAHKATSGRLTDRHTGVPVRGGSVQWDRSLPDDSDTFVGLDGRTYEVDSLRGAFAMYSITVHLLQAANEMMGLLAEATGTGELQGIAMREGAGGSILSAYSRSGIYEGLDSSDPLVRDLAIETCNGFVQFGTALRVLSRMYRRQGLSIEARPQVWQRRGVSLARILFRGAWNPMAATRDGQVGLPFLVQPTRPEGWGVLGMQVISRFRDAYRPVIHLPAAQERVLSEDFMASARAMSQDGRQDNVPWLGLAVLIIAIGFASAVYRVGGAVCSWLGYNVPFMKAAADEYRRLMRECRGGDDRACQLAEDLADQANGFKPPPGTLIRGLLLAATGIATVGAVVFGRKALAPHVKRLMPNAVKPLLDGASLAT